MDYCGMGLRDTCAALDAAGISHVGAGADYAAASAPVIVQRSKVRVGFLAYSLIVPLQSAARQSAPGINYLPRDWQGTLGRDVAALRQQCDFAVVCFHWGTEGHTVPDKLQRSIGHAAIDAGANLVIGTHPHTLQGVEFYGNGVIAYSLGNFVFTGASHQLAGAMLQVSISPTPDSAGQFSITDVALLPCWISDGRPTPSNSKRLLQILAGAMRATNSSLTTADSGWLTVQPLR